MLEDEIKCTVNITKGYDITCQSDPCRGANMPKPYPRDHLRPKAPTLSSAFFTVPSLSETLLCIFRLPSWVHPFVEQRRQWLWQYEHRQKELSGFTMASNSTIQEWWRVETVPRAESRRSSMWLCDSWSFLLSWSFVLDHNTASTCSGSNFKFWVAVLSWSSHLHAQRLLHRWAQWFENLSDALLSRWHIFFLLVSCSLLCS